MKSNLFSMQFLVTESISFLEFFGKLSPVMQTFLATMFTFLITALGASFVLFFKKVNYKVLDFMMGLAGGIMIAASFWSLIMPAINLCEQLGKIKYLTPAIGFLCGGLFIILSDVILNKFVALEEGKKKSILLTSAVILHNIPEGMAIGVGFGTLFLGISDMTLIGAILLAFGIGIQNFPEGTCVAMPLRSNGVSKGKSFIIGALSAIVEPIFGIIAVLFSIRVQNMLPFLLTFSAGAMIAVVCSELIPDAFKDNKVLASFGIIFGFIVMMVLDVALG